MLGILGIDYVVCPICGKEGKRIYKHIKNVHNMELEEFRKLYPNSETTCSSLRDQIKYNTTKSLNKDEVVRKRREFRNSPEGRDMARRNGSKVWEVPGFREYLRENNSRIMKELWKDEDFRKSQSERIVKSLNCDRIHILHHNRLVKQWENEEYRKKITEMVANMASNGVLGARKEFTDNRGVKCIFRSSWEFEVHNILNDLEIEHLYEKEKFVYMVNDLYRIYIPDFFIPSLNLFLEVKPKCFQDNEDNLRKLDVVRDAGYNITYVGDDEYNNVDKIKEILNIM